ncbi:MAG: hypothetical protein LBB10_00515 [Bifidobacteriaceae bacterium]|jgi:hypothetical protein|nr:hypothetical protein [Bifidobacteriaceae bacterium]
MNTKIKLQKIGTIITVLLFGAICAIGGYEIRSSTDSNSSVLPVAKGGTGGNSPESARTALDAQKTLVSGTNIKTINDNSIVGSGNLETGLKFGYIPSILATQSCIYDNLSNATYSFDSYGKRLKIYVNSFSKCDQFTFYLNGIVVPEYTALRTEATGRYGWGSFVFSVNSYPGIGSCMQDRRHSNTTTPLLFQTSLGPNADSTLSLCRKTSEYYSLKVVLAGTAKDSKVNNLVFDIIGVTSIDPAGITLTDS